MSIDDQLQQEAEKMIRLAGREHLKNKLKNLESAHPGTNNSYRLNQIVRKLSIGAAAAVLILASLWWIQNTKPVTPEKLFANNFEPYRSPEGVRGETPDAELLWKNAVALYSDQNYNSAALNFMELAQNDDSYFIQFYLGQSLLNLGADQAEQAANAFRKVLETEHDYRQQAQWYLALAYIKSSDTVQASTVLEEIAGKEGHYKQNEAKNLLKKL